MITDLRARRQLDWPFIQDGSFGGLFASGGLPSPADSRSLRLDGPLSQDGSVSLMTQIGADHRRSTQIFLEGRTPRAQARAYTWKVMSFFGSVSGRPWRSSLSSAPPKGVLPARSGG